MNTQSVDTFIPQEGSFPDGFNRVVLIYNSHDALYHAQLRTSLTSARRAGLFSIENLKLEAETDFSNSIIFSPWVDVVVVVLTPTIIAENFDIFEKISLSSVKVVYALAASCVWKGVLLGAYRLVPNSEQPYNESTVSQVVQGIKLYIREKILFELRRSNDLVFLAKAFRLLGINAFNYVLNYLNVGSSPELKSEIDQLRLPPIPTPELYSRALEKLFSLVKEQKIGLKEICYAIGNVNM